MTMTDSNKARLALDEGRAPDYVPGLLAELDRLRRLEVEAWLRQASPAQLAEALGTHLRTGLCPDEIEGWDSRDLDCWSCWTLDVLIQILQEKP